MTVGEADPFPGARNILEAQHTLPASVAFLFEITDGEDQRMNVIMGTSGPGLGWESVLRRAVREFCRQRGDLLASELDVAQVHTLLPDARRSEGWKWHVQVLTSRYIAPFEGAAPSRRRHRLDIWVRRLSSDRVDRDR